MQFSMFMPECDWTPPDMGTLPDLKDADLIALDTETYDPNLKDTGPSVRTGGHIAGVSLAIEGGPRFYLPMRHEGGDNLDVDQCEDYLRTQAKRFKGRMTGANLGYDLDFMAEAGIDFLYNRDVLFQDIQIAEPLLNELKFSYSLDNLAKEWLGEPKQNQLMMEAAAALGMKKKDNLGSWIHKLPGRYVGYYAESDVRQPLEILKQQLVEIEKQELEEVWDLESRCLPVLIKMRRRGVRVDEDRLTEVEIRCTKELRDASDFISRESGVRVGPDDSMKKSVLMEALRAVGHQLEPDDAIDKYFIAGRQDTCPVVAAIGRLRKWSTLMSLSIEPTKKHLVNGRIHCTFNQLRRDRDDEKGLKGAAYGRVSCSDTNMQQQPSRDEEIAPIWRRVYIPEEGQKWLSCDYSQQEPRIGADIAEKVFVKGHTTNLDDGSDVVVPFIYEIGGHRFGGRLEAESAFKVAQAYRDDPDTDSHQMMADLSNIKRKAAKVLNLGVIYGMGELKLCRDLGLPTKVIRLRNGKMISVAGDEGKAIIDTYHTRNPHIRSLTAMMEARARENGFIRTMSGRKCRFPLTEDGLNYDWVHKAMNRYIQGTAADQTKRALVLVDGWEQQGDTIFLQLQVHDELTASGPKEHGEVISDLMRQAYPLRVPTQVDVEIGRSWGEAA